LGYEADYDPTSDLFRFAPIDESGDPDPDLSDEEAAEHFGPIVIGGMTLYPFGTGAWIRDERQEASTAASDAGILRLCSQFMYRKDFTLIRD